MRKLLSIIIPVYNGEKYIDECLRSVLNQSYRELEIIIINDGSTDNSYAILQEYAKKDKRIILIDQQNCGSSLTRNNGIKHATGDYITFVDIDDHVEIDTYDKVMKKLTDDIDIICFGVSCDYKKEKYSVIKKLTVGAYNKSDAVIELFNKDVFNAVWNKVYKKELIKDKDYFPSEFNQGEDLIFNCKVFKNAQKIILMSEVLYHYIYQENATMISSFTKNNDMVLKFKQKNVFALLNDIDMQVYYDYMLKEYEVFVINLFMKNNELSFKEKCMMIQENLTDKNVIKKGIPATFYGNIFKMAASTNTFIMVLTYYILTFAKNMAGNSYSKVRKLIYKRNV